MPRPPSPRAVFVSALVGLFLACSACSQGNGERCQQNDDCASGFCFNPGSSQTAEGGRCCANATACATGGTSDGAIDGGVMDGGPDSPADSAMDVPMDAPMESLPVDGSAAETSDDTMSADGGDALSSSDATQDLATDM